MKLLITLLLITSVSCAKTSPTQLMISGCVSVITKANLTWVSPNVFVIHEVSNNPLGYSVVINTDATSITYNGVKTVVTGGQAVLTSVNIQTVSVDVVKTLVLSGNATYIQVIVISN